MPKAALLLIDLQNEVLHPQGTLSGDLPAVAGGLVESVRRLVSWARAHGLPVIWVRLAYRAGYVDASRSVRDSATTLAGRLVDGTWGAELLDGIGREKDDVVITKKRSSAFCATDLDFVLRGLGVETLVIGGTSTNWAVESTVRDAESLDYRAIVVREATGARVRVFHEPALQSMASRYSEVKGLAEVLAWTP